MRSIWPMTLLAATLVVSCQARVATLAPVRPYIEDSIPLAATATVSPETAALVHDAAGTKIMIGAAFAQYTEAFVDAGFSGTHPSVHVGASLLDVRTQNFRIDLVAEIEVTRDGEKVFHQRYEGTSSQNAWDGMYSDRNQYWSQATNEALRSIFRAFLEDAQLAHTQWLPSSIEDDQEVDEL